ncbi:MAG: hypothetical protein RR595_00720 [Lysinibacillus sp.]
MPQFIFMTITFIVSLILTFSSYFIKINGLSALDITNRFPVMVTPINLSYVIWIVIYVLLGYWLVMNFKIRATKSTLSAQQMVLFGVVNILQMFFIIARHQQQFAVALAILALLLLCLFTLYNTYSLSNNAMIGRMPISIYFAWSTFLFITNISFTLTSYEWDGLGLSNPLWAVILLTLGTAIALHIRFHHFDIAYPIVFIWSYIGIALHNGFDELLVTTASLFLCGVMIVGIFFIKKNPAYQK